MTTEAVTTQGIATQGVTTQGVTTQGITTQGITTQGVTTQGVTTQGITTQAATMQPPTTQPDTSSGPDTRPPVITGCPDNIMVIAAFGETSAAVSWIPPTAVDNSGVAPRIFNNFNPGDVFPQGNTEVLYAFVDEALNSETCRFMVTVTAGEE